MYKKNGQKGCDGRGNISQKSQGQAELNRCKWGDKAIQEEAAGWPPDGENTGGT